MNWTTCFSVYHWTKLHNYLIFRIFLLINTYAFIFWMSVYMSAFIWHGSMARQKKERAIKNLQWQAIFGIYFMRFFVIVTIWSLLKIKQNYLHTYTWPSTSCLLESNKLCFTFIVIRQKVPKFLQQFRN